MLFTDDFEDGLTDQWVTSGGTWAIATDGTKVYAQTATGTGSSLLLSAAGSTTWTDQIVEATIGKHWPSAAKVPRDVSQAFPRALQRQHVLLRAPAQRRKARHPRRHVVDQQRRGRVDRDRHHVLPCASSSWVRPSKPT